ncbi:MAG: hypothetical protein JNK82_08935 [Myxococcaceae bacterium]|nr:hypothetical protein [Myxococcaceae bacterium]
MPDAGTPIERGTDLHTALNIVFPEYRGVVPLGARVQVTRWAAPGTPMTLDEALEAARKNGFTGVPLKRDPFNLELQLDGGVLFEQVYLGLAAADVGRIQGAPASMTSEGLANWLPKVGTRQREELLLELVWLAKDVARADFLVWQLVTGALKSEWACDALPSGFELERVDGGAVQVPETFELTLRQNRGGASLEVERKKDRAWLRYRLITYERR